MDQNLIFMPVMMQVFLTLLIYVGITIIKNKAMAAGQVDESRRALYKDAWPDDVLKYTNNLANQYEAPVLFYTLCFIIWATQSVNMESILFAWAFAISRYAHAYVHTGSNNVSVRKPIFMFGMVNVIALFVCASIGVLA